MNNGEITTQTIEEYKAYIKQLEGSPRQEHDTEIDTLASGNRNLSEVINAMSAELEELRKHELEWELDKAKIKELESEIKQIKEGK